jgi:hypothetical protein
MNAEALALRAIAAVMQVPKPSEQWLSNLDLAARARKEIVEAQTQDEYGSVGKARINVSKLSERCEGAVWSPVATCRRQHGRQACRNRVAQANRELMANSGQPAAAVTTPFL